MTAEARGQNNSALRLQCPACRCRIPDVGIANSLHTTCPGCGFAMTEVNGIMRALTPASKAHFERFIRDYEVVREKEGWGSQTPDYYLALPFKDLTNRHNWIWRVRARTLLYLQNHLLPKLESTHPTCCRILDIGAGNGWLSYRLAKLGYDPVAVDLLDNDADSLGLASLRSFRFMVDK